jgi:hypothetical protein
MKTGIELLESNDKVIAVIDKDVLESKLVEAMKTGAVEKVVAVLTNGSYGRTSYELDTQIREAITKAVVKKFMQENYQAVYEKINLNTVANMAAVNIAKGVAQ